MTLPATIAFRIAIVFIASCAISAGAEESKPIKPPGANRAQTKTKSAPAKRTTVKRTPNVQRKSDVSGPLYAAHPDAMAAADNMAQRLNLDPQWVRQAVGQSRYVAAVARAVVPAPTGTPKNWAVYRSRFIDPVRIRAGVKFWQDNRETLQRAYDQMGVPPQIIVGIIGVETIYGQQLGSYRVMDALTTLAFDFPSQHPRAAERSRFFLSELEAFLALTHRTGTDPMAVLGSYAGAMGLPQFMPSSWQKYAIDFDGDARVDLFHSPADVIGSVANYFKAFGWKPGMPTHYPVRLLSEGANKATLLAPDIVPSFTSADLVGKGAQLDAAGLLHTGLLALVELQNGQAEPLYLAGTDNFYTITRYNWSSYYALAVIELGQEVAAAMSK